MSSLKNQLEKVRFERALEVSESMAAHRVLLTVTELARLNNILTGKKDDHDPWRNGPITFNLPSGRTETMALLSDPKLSTREKLHRATELSEGSAIIDGAVHIYAGIVLAYPFEDANRRTAVLAANYFLQRYGVPLSGVALHEIGLGDLREEGQLDALRETMHQMAKFAAKRKPSSGDPQ